LLHIFPDFFIFKFFEFMNSIRSILNLDRAESGEFRQNAPNLLTLCGSG
jgi:hypothetical protein